MKFYGIIFYLPNVISKNVFCVFFYDVLRRVLDVQDQF